MSIELFGSYRSGAALCSPNQTSMCSLTQPLRSENLPNPNWIEDFNELVMREKRVLPRPAIYVTPEGTKLPVFTGGLVPSGCIAREDMEWVYLIFKKEYKQVIFSSLFTPTDAQYRRYFKKVIENTNIRIVTSGGASRIHI